MSINLEKKTVTENSSLMKKTKAQLVEIILRKDEVERNLQDTIKNNKSLIKNQSDGYDYLKNEYDKLKEYNTTLKYDYEEMCDRYSTAMIKYNFSNKKNRNIIFIASVINILLFIAIIIVKFI